jgi:hypothetical protein
LFDKLTQLWRRLLIYARRNQFDRELEEEMQFHLEMKAKENIAEGKSVEEARYAARRQFGNQTLLLEASRDMWGFRPLETLAQDMRYGLRIFICVVFSFLSSFRSETSHVNHQKPTNRVAGGDRDR